MLSKLQTKIELLTKYLTDIVYVIKAYSNNDNVKSTKDLHLVAEELANIILEGKSNISYLSNVEQAENFVAMQTQVVEDGDKTSFYFSTSNRTTLYNSKSGTTVYSNGTSRSNNITNYIVSDKINEEGWTPFDIIIRTVNFNDFYVRNSNIVALRCKLNLENVTLDDFCTDNKKLRTAHISTNAQFMSRAFKNCESLTYCNFENDTQPKICDEMFVDCKNLLSVKLDLSKCSSAIDIFKNCNELQKIELINNKFEMSELDLSYCKKMTLNTLLSLLNSLEKNEGDIKTVYIAHNLLSSAQKTAFKNKGYNVVYKTNE